MVRVPNCGGLF